MCSRPGRPGAAEGLDECVIGIRSGEAGGGGSAIEIATKTLQTVESVSAGTITWKEVCDPIGKYVSAEFESMATPDPS